MQRSIRLLAAATSSKSPLAPLSSPVIPRIAVPERDSIAGLLECEPRKKFVTLNKTPVRRHQGQI